MSHPHLLLLLALIASSYSYLLADDSYFYLNSSYAKQTISFTMCFRIDTPASLTLISDILVPQ